jgi:hypothetical protein
MLPRMATTNWEVTRGRQVCYAQVTAREVIVGSHSGSGHTDSAGACSHAEFLAGRFQDLVRSDLGEATLQEMIAAVRAAPENPAFAAEFARVRGVRALLLAMPHDPDLPALLAWPDRVDGQWPLHEGCPVALTGGGAALFIDRALNAVVTPPGDPPVRHTLPGYVSGAVFAAGVWALNIGGLFALDPTGRRRSPEALAAAPWGTLLRGWDVYAVGERILYAYRWFDAADGGPGVCEFRPDAGFVGHCPLDATPRPAPRPAGWVTDGPARR